MGAILGIAVYGRTQEKLGGAAGGGISVASAAPSFSAPTSSSVSTVPYTAPVVVNNTMTAKAKPAEPDHPVL
jgi:hypothetical protein